ncbi:MAG TPA: hypothetical protein VHE82_05870, partial [Gemmatimonadaceae bacterium]|nr:hypothetical protein [Gemmatimonadaceae bacterium]
GLLLVSVWASPLRAQDTTRVTADSAVVPASSLYRNPKRALILGSVIPGAGHIYAGEYVQGFFIYEATVGGIGGGVMTFIFDRCMLSFLSATHCDSGPQWPHQVLGVALVGAGIWEWISSARDAPHAAERANAKHRRQTFAATPIIEAPVDAYSGWRVGAAIHW